jgi:hypothetical protein
MRYIVLAVNTDYTVPSAQEIASGVSIDSPGVRGARAVEVERVDLEAGLDIDQLDNLDNGEPT